MEADQDAMLPLDHDIVPPPLPMRPLALVGVAISTILAGVGLMICFQGQRPKKATMRRHEKIHHSWIPQMRVIIGIATLVTTLCMLGCSEDARHTSIGDLGIHEVAIADFSAPPRVEVAWPQLRVMLSPTTIPASSVWVKVHASRSGDMVILSGRYTLAEVPNVKDFDLRKLGVRDDRQAQVSIWWLDPDGRRQCLSGGQNPVVNDRK